MITLVMMAVPTGEQFDVSGSWPCATLWQPNSFSTLTTCLSFPPLFSTSHPAVVLIGCLPSYEQAGLAAPILLSLLRVVQGIAVGGELGTAVVFMHELAPAKHKSKAGSIVFIGVTTGIMMALILSMIVSAAIPPGDKGLLRRK